MASTSAEYLANIDRLYFNHFTPQGAYIDVGELVAVFKTEQFALDFFSQHKDKFSSTLTLEQKQITFKCVERQRDQVGYHDPYAIPFPPLKPNNSETVLILKELIGESTVQTLFAQEYARNRQFNSTPSGRPEIGGPWRGEW